MPHYPDTQLLIDGTWRGAADGGVIEVYNPATGLVIGTVAHAAASDLDAAVDAAARAFPGWSRTSPVERARLMHAAADLLRQRGEEIAALITLEQGKPLAQARIEAFRTVDMIRWFAEEAVRSYGRIIPARDPSVLQMTIKHPVGPVVAFTPWNFPVGQVVRKLSAALATGCTIIVKASEETPAAPAALIRCFTDAGIPAGVVGLLFGNPAQISERLIPDRAIRKVTFTGSTAVGKKLAALAGSHMKRVTMELGGHAPVIVFDDADIAGAAPQIAGNKFRNAGQICTSPTRFLLQDGVAGDFTERFVAAAEQVVAGDGFDPASTMGPLANPRRILAIENLVADAVGRGARLLTGGRTLGNQGWFYAPTVLADVPVDAQIMNEEPFGPVAILNRFDTADEALAEANRLDYGLAAYAYTRSGANMQRLRAELVSGMLTINHLGLAHPELPFGGVRDSGYGTEGGADALEAYLETRFVTQMN